MKILNCLSKVLLGFGYLIWTIAGFWGFCIELSIVHEIAGFWGIVIAFSILPVTLFAAPFYALIVNGDWFPLALIYGGGFIGAIICGIGLSIMENIQKQERKREYLREGEEK